jgi:flagellar assembly protein FliH
VSEKVESEAMTHLPGARAPWVQHAGALTESALGRLPHLWQEVPVSDLSHTTSPAAAASADLAARLAEVEQKAAAEREAAQAEIAHWRDRARAVEEEARAKGYAEGFAAGQQEGRLAGEMTACEAARSAIERLQQISDGAVADLGAARREARDQLVDLSLEIAGAIIAEAFAHDRTLLARRVASLLERMAESATAIVRVHPESLSQVKDAWLDAARERDGNGTVPRFVADEHIAPGGCVIETHTQQLDGRIETLTQLVREAFARTSAREDKAPTIDVQQEAAA